MQEQTNPPTQFTIPKAQTRPERPRNITVYIKDHKNNVLMMFQPQQGVFVTTDNRAQYPDGNKGDQVFLMTDDSVRDKAVSWGMVKNMVHAAEKHCNMIYAEIIDNVTGLVNNNHLKEPEHN